MTFLQVPGAIGRCGTKIAKKVNKYCLLFVKNVGYLCYTPHQLDNAFFAYFPFENSLLKLET